MSAPTDLTTTVACTVARLRQREHRPRARTLAVPKRQRQLARVRSHEELGQVGREPGGIKRERRCEAEGPCPWVGCKHHLYLDVNPETGTLKLNFPDLEPWELEEPCALRIARAGGRTLDEVGVLMNLTRERVRQIEAGALRKLRRSQPEVLADAA